jgi:hypothetical protein
MLLFVVCSICCSFVVVERLLRFVAFDCLLLLQLYCCLRLLFLAFDYGVCLYCYRCYSNCSLFGSAAAAAVYVVAVGNGKTSTDRSV